MPYTTLVFLYRKPGMTPEAFRDYYSYSHLQLIRELTGSAFPRVHRQHYIQRTDANAAGSGPSPSPVIDAADYASSLPEGQGKGDEENNRNTSRNATTPATVLLGSQSEFDFDCVATLQFDDVDGFKAFFEKVKIPANLAQIIADEENFLDRSLTRTAVLGDVVELRPLA